MEIKYIETEERGEFYIEENGKKTGPYIIPVGRNRPHYNRTHRSIRISKR